MGSVSTTFLLIRTVYSTLLNDSINHKEWHEHLMKATDKGDAEKNRTVSFLLDHAVKTKDLLYFAHCSLFDRPPCAHCLKLPLSDMLPEIKNKYGFIPIPLPSPRHPGMQRYFFLSFFFSVIFF
jgi:hypothetical protein